MSLQALIERLNKWMTGRNGSDELGNAALLLSIVVLLINLLARTRWLAVIALALAVYSCWRTVSKNVAARRQENRLFLTKVGPLANWFKDPKASFAEARAYKHLTCPSCQKKMRVPRGKGKMRVTCPSCHKKFDARS